MVSKMLKVAAVPVGLVVSSYGLYAVSDREAKGDRLNPHQLSVYTIPPQESRFIEASPGRVQCVFSTLRETVWPAVTWTRACDCCSRSLAEVVSTWLLLQPVIGCRRHISLGRAYRILYDDAGTSVRNGVEETIQFGKDSYVYLKNPPPEFLPRVGVISVSGLAGLVLARRGSRLKKLLYPAGLAALGASVCYPAHAVIFAKVTSKKLYSAGHRTYDAVSSLWKTTPQNEATMPARSEDARETPREEDGGAAESPAGHHTREHQEPTSASAPASSSSPIDPAEPSTSRVPTEQPKDVKFQPPPELVDHGQSNPEDVDLYSTRT